MFDNNKIFLILLIQVVTNGVSSDLLLQMPNVKPEVETNLCRSYEINVTTYITGFVPGANFTNKAHHILVYSCDSPGNLNRVWDCGEMADGKPGSGYEPAPACTDERVIYAWAMDAPTLQLPEDISFKVGGATGPRYLVLQVHYKDVEAFKNGGSDASFVNLKTSTTPTSKLAGVYLIYTGSGIIPPGETDLEASCVYEEDIPLHPFAFRVHAHTHGVEVTGKITRNKIEKVIGQRSPQLPQMFQSIADNTLTIQHGDKMSVNCSMKNKEKKTFKIGSTASDEMCNFYVMYWVEGGKLPREFLCPDPEQQLNEGENDVGRLLFDEDDNWNKIFKKLTRQSLGKIPFFGGSEDPAVEDYNSEYSENNFAEMGQVRAGGLSRPVVHSEAESSSEQSSYENGKQKFFNKQTAHNRYNSDDDDNY